MIDSHPFIKLLNDIKSLTTDYENEASNRTDVNLNEANQSNLRNSQRGLSVTTRPVSHNCVTSG